MDTLQTTPIVPPSNLANQPPLPAKPFVYNSMAFTISACVFGMIVSFLILPLGVVRQIQGYISRTFLGQPYIMVSSQPLRTPIIVDRARITKPGFIVVFFGDYYNSPTPDEITRRVLPVQGEYRGGLPVEIDIEEIEELEATMRPVNDEFVPAYNRNQPVFAALIFDDGDNEFSVQTDSLGRDAFGNPLVSRIFLR